MQTIMYYTLQKNVMYQIASMQNYQCFKQIPPNENKRNKHCYHLAILVESKIPLNDSFVKIVQNSIVINIQMFHCSFR